MIAIIDYDAGNIKSVEKAFLALGENIVLTRDKETLLNADGVVLPGVGSFGDAMAKLSTTGELYCSFMVAFDARLIMPPARQ